MDVSCKLPRLVLLLPLLVLLLPARADAHCVAQGKETCYHDNREDRTLPFPGPRPPPHANMDRQTCMQLCADASYVLAGFEDGGQCFCGNAVKAGATPSDPASCSMPCRGNASETCGGNDFVTVVSFACSGPPDPAPAPGPPPHPSPPGPPAPPIPPLPPPTKPPKGAMNVLSIMIDDLRPQLGCYNISVCGRKMQTPHIDALAARGLTFRHAFTQYAVCSPSRNSCA
jgi:hypothetical protein